MEERTKPRLFDSVSELEELLAAFNEARIPRPVWTHREHLAVAAMYVLQQQGLDEFRPKLQALNEANGVPQTPTGGYHETITVVWMKLIGDWVAKHRDLSNLEAVNAVLELFGDKDYLLRYYSHSRLMSVEARYGWAEPDIEPL